MPVHILQRPLASRRSQASAAGRGALVLAIALQLPACDALDNALDVEAPSRIPAAGLEDPSRANLLLNGAIADFDCAFGAYVVVSGLVGEELIDATQTAGRWPYDRREVLPTDATYQSSSCIAIGIYTPLATARFSADNILAKLEGWTDAQVPNRASMIATAAAYSGYAHLLIGEAFCTAAIDLSPELQRNDIWTRAEAKFTRAIEAARAAGNRDILNMALVGRARTRLNLGNRAGAAADARQVERNYVRNATASTVSSRRENRVFAQNNQGQLVSVGPAYRNLTFGGMADPRVRVTDTGRTAAEGTRIWVQNKYSGLAASLPIATYDEAQLIVAEVEGGQTAVNIINAFHTRAGLGAFTSTDPAAIRQQVIEERRRELFLEGHHLGDIARYNLPLNPAPGIPFSKGGTYGDQRCLPLPDVERLNNPNITR